jgi:hypothetical protein
MMFLRKGSRPLVRSNAIDPNIDRTNSAYDNWPLFIVFEESIKKIYNEDDHQKKCIEYANFLDYEYISTIQLICDEAEDSMQITLPHKPVWEKRGAYLLNTETGEEKIHEKHIDEGWNCQRICWNYVPRNV